MWIFLIGIIVELVILGMLSTRLIQLSFTTLMRITRSRSISITILTIILFPGTVIHELSHLFTAEIMGVRTGTLTLAPESIDDTDIQSGSVQVEVTDPFRRTLIGIAPTVTGILTLSALSWWLSTVVTQVSTLPYQLLAVGILYLILTVSNTMFTSKEDLKGVLPVAIIVALLGITVYFSGIHITLPLTVLSLLATIVRTLAQNLAIVIAINLIGLLIHTLILTILHKRRLP
jgi:hypothetical protein